MEESSSPVPCRWPEKWQNMVEKAEKSDFFIRQNCQKSGKNPAKTAQNPGKMTEKGRQNTGGGHPLRYRGRAELVTACHRFDPARRGGGASSARPVRGGLSSGAGCCCPLLYSYVGRGGARSPTGAGIIGPARGCGGIIGPARGCGGIIGPAWPVRGDLSSGAGCCCPLLYSYVGRRGAISYRRGIIGPARGGGVVLPVQRPAAGGCDLHTGGGAGV